MNTVDHRQRGLCWVCSQKDGCDKATNFGQERCASYIDGRVLKVYRLVLKQEHHEYDCPTAMVVLAHSEGQARVAACGQARDEGAMAWQLPEHSTCNEIPTTGEPSVVLCQTLDG